MADNQLKKNTLKLGEFEKSIQELNTITSNVKTKVDGELEEIVGLKTDLLNIKNDSELKLAESNNKITSKIKQKFQSVLPRSYVFFPSKPYQSFEKQKTKDQNMFLLQKTICKCITQTITFIYRLLTIQVKSTQFEKFVLEII